MNLRHASLALALCGAIVAMPRPAHAQPTDAALAWPEITPTARPWTRWWWQGSAVTPAELTAAIEAYRDAGLGGLELTPIYGVRGEESRFVPFLSPEWVTLLEHTLRETRRTGLGLDMATGTGWPFGGPWVSRDESSRTLVIRTYDVRGGEGLPGAVATTQEPLVRAVGQIVYDLEGSILGPQAAQGTPPVEKAVAAPKTRPIRIDDLVDPTSANRNLQVLALDQVRFPRALPLIALIAYSEAGDVIDLTTRRRDDGLVDWVAPAGTWRVHAVFLGWHGKQVERAAPGGEGDVIDHFSAPALGRYLARFDAAFAGHDVSGIRAFFNDSYEVDDAKGQADGTPRLFEEFAARRGYDLRRHLPALLGEESPDVSARVLSDYRETISDLLLDGFTSTWRAWAAGKGAIVRNQAHGAPANILDLYAASDVPETEGTDLLRIKFASSAAHVSGKPLASAEAATWLGDHFLSSLGDVKQAVDRDFLGGVNHVVYHGTAYSPRAAAWPGWLFYASVHFQPTNPQWRDFRALNDYVARVQGFLQQGVPDNDVLVYFPFHDLIARRGDGLLAHFDGGGALLEGTPFRRDAGWLQAQGYAFDYVSDRQVATLRASASGVDAAGSRYALVVVPGARVVPLETMERLLALAQDGATVAFTDALPSDVPGLDRLEARRAGLARLLGGLSWREEGGVREARVGRGRILTGERLDALVVRAGIAREAMVDRGVQFTRRRAPGATTYFLANRGTTIVDGWLPVARAGRAAVLFDPMRERRGGAALRTGADGRQEVYAQLAPGESCVLRVFDQARESGDRRAYPDLPRYRPSGDPRAVAGAWRLAFVSGGPELPPAADLAAPGSWTELAGDAGRAFSGTARYTARFPRPAGAAPAWRIDLGQVHESARVTLNGHLLGTLLGPDFTVVAEAEAFADANVLEVEVSNLMANRIADMDRRGVPWKVFYNANMPASLAENRGADGLFDASRWAPRPSGLIGPVTLTPLARLE